jgi:hypothetical protein
MFISSINLDLNHAHGYYGIQASGNFQQNGIAVIFITKGGI